MDPQHCFKETSVSDPYSLNPDRVLVPDPVLDPVLVPDPDPSSFLK